MIGLCVGDREPRADRQRRELIHRVAAGAPVRKLLLIEAFPHPWMPFAVEDEAETCTQQSEAALLRSDAATALRFYREGIAALTGASPEARWRYSLQAADSLQEFGNRAGRNEALLASIELYKLALRTADRDRVPLDWATTQTNLGNALLMLGERESGTGRLEEAVAAFRAALEERTRDRVPLDWAASTGNQGIALMLLAKRLGRRK